MGYNFDATLREACMSHGDLDYSIWNHPAGDDVPIELRFIAEFNRDLDMHARLSELNEEYLAGSVDLLDKQRSGFTELYEMTRVRLHELLLLCAANYANCCEYGAVGELMFNPRRVLVHVSGVHEPIVKDRHKGLTEQFRDKADTTAGVIHWLKDETSIEIVKRPLMPHSYKALEGCAFVSKSYLDSARERAGRIVELISFLHCGGFKDVVELDLWRRKAGAEDRALLESKFLSLEWEVFTTLGRHINMMLHRYLGIAPLSS